MTHSGDLQSAPNGASEFIDIDRKKALKGGARYIVMGLFSYSNVPFINLPECFSGVMTRKVANNGEIYEPKTVKNKFDITADSKLVVPLILDLKDNEMIWADISLATKNKFRNNLESSTDTIKLMGKGMLEMLRTKPNIYELLSLHVKARGELVENKEDADLVFTSDDFPFNIDEILGEYLV
jgi:hypothetical protein